MILTHILGIDDGCVLPVGSDEWPINGNCSMKMSVNNAGILMNVQIFGSHFC